MDKNEVLIILETAKDEDGKVPMRLVRQAFEKIPELCEDTISRQQAIDAITVAQDELHNAHAVGLIRAKKIISELPSAQSEIVHCEFCEHWKNRHLCECLSRHGTFETPKDFFCGYGKAK